MSAIWGMIHLDHSQAEYKQGIKMQQAMGQYKLDRCLTIKRDNAVFGCGLQYITKESVKERLPYYDEKNKQFYVADCMLDNRQEIMKKLSLIDDLIPDGALLYQAYLTWGSKFTEHVLGVFSFVIYDGNNTCTLFTDHTGSRSLYYCLVENTLYFATIFAPLLAVLPAECRKINEKWIAVCELHATPVTEFFTGLTPFEQIYQVMAGHTITVNFRDSKSVIEKRCYWRLESKKEIKFKTHDEYRKLFVKTLRECIGSVLRSSKETGITLSSGLDSSSVACIAAQCLQEENKKLHSYTSVPLSEYISDQSPYYITNETDGVKCICEAYTNIEPEFVDCKGKNACTELNRVVRYLEFPHKSRQNMVWLDEIYERAALKGCKVVLKGQYGNATISQGRILGRAYEEITKLRFLTAYRQVSYFCKKNKISRKRVLKIFIKELGSKLAPTKESFSDTLVRKEILKRHGIIKIMNKICKEAGSDSMLSKSQRHKFMYDLNAFAQLGAMDTRFGLYHGIILRDPLRDKRMIELCASFPIKCFVQDGVERAVVRNYMRGIVPDEILDVVNRRGLQSADYITRLQIDWDRSKQTMLQLLGSSHLIDYIDLSKLEQIKEGIRMDNNDNLEDCIMSSLMLCSCSVFLEHFGI